MVIDKLDKIQEDLHKKEDKDIEESYTMEEIFWKIKKILMVKAQLYRQIMNQVSIAGGKLLEQMIEKDMELNDLLWKIGNKLMK